MKILICMSYNVTFLLNFFFILYLHFFFISNAEYSTYHIINSFSGPVNAGKLIYDCSLTCGFISKEK